MSDTYRRGKKPKKMEQHSLLDTIGATIALKMMRRFNIGLIDAMRVGKFLGVFVLIFTAPYSMYKSWKLSAKIRSMNKGKDENL